MKIRHAIALALVGWYLMMPPPDPSNLRLLVDVNAPLAKWINWEGFDTAAECNNGQAVLQKSAFDKRDADPKDIGNRGYAAQMTYSQCVETDDPRLAK